MTTTIQRLARLKALGASYRADAAAPLARLREGTRFVPGQGALRPTYAFIGEAPGQAEEKLGAPFQGPSGRMLNELLASIGVERQDVYVTNIVKYRPPNNRDPRPDEVAASVPYLRAELRAVGALYWVTLGRHALEALHPGVRLADVHGQWQGLGDAPPRHPWLMPLYHPAVALYRASFKGQLLEDFAKLKEVPS